MSRGLILLVIVACFAGLWPAGMAGAREAVLFVTDWSRSMNGRAEGNLRRRELVPAIVNSYFGTLSSAADPPMVGLITFGNTGNADSPEDEKVCEQDVTLAVPADTDFRAAKVQVPGVVESVRPKGFTPIFSAISRAADVAGTMLDNKRATAVRIVLVTDLADVCDAAGGYRRLQADEYCALGTQVRKTVAAVDEQYRGIVKLEFVVAVGENQRNIGQIAECAKATSLAANNLEQARVVGQIMAGEHKVALVPEPTLSTLQFWPFLDGEGDAFGRDTGSEKMTLQVNGEATPVIVEGAVTRETGTTGSLRVETTYGVDVPPVEVLFQGDSVVDVPWWLPRLSLRVSAPSFALLRSIETGQEIRLDIQQEASVSLLPGAYQVVVGYESGGWDVRNVTVSRNVPDQQVAFTAPAGTVNAVWQGPADGTVGAAGPLSASLQVGAEQAQALPLRQPLQLLVPEGATDATVTLRRSDHDVWEQRHRVSPGATTEITLSGGPVWVTAGPTAQGASSEWRLIDQTQDPPALTYFRGARFAQPLAPGVYQLSVDGTKLCAEGESFKVRIGRPVDFGTGPSWITKGICE